MAISAFILTALVALLHVWIMVLEMFLWTTPYGRKTFGMKVEQAEVTRVLAQNQGLYNGFLAAGLIWGLSSQDLTFKAFFLMCIIVAGIFGAMTVNKRIFFVQTVPAALALALNYFA